jgi:uncharacterized protein (TIGR02996 family)
MGRSRDRGPDRSLRRYKVTLFGETLGTFLLPVGEHLANPQAMARPIVTRPYRAGELEDATYYWAEPDDDDEQTTVSWQPENREQQEAAERFYSEAHGLGDDGRIDPDKQSPLFARSVDETRLIRAVLANPEAEQPYLDYADWLTLRGDPYGEYIRLSCQMEPLDEDDEHRERLSDRQYDLVQRHGPKWIVGLTDLGLYPGLDWEDADDFDPNWWFGEKGVIENLDIPCDTLVFRKNPARLFAAAPFLRYLSVSDSEVTLAELAAIPQMAQIEALSVSVAAGEDGFRRFAESPHFGGLRWLTLAGYDFGPDVAAVLAGA